jgi:hypothetical protein
MGGKSESKKLTEDYTEAEYYDLLTTVTNEVTQRYGSVANFTRHDDFQRAGFKGKDGSRVTTVLSIPATEERVKQKMKSFPTLNALFTFLYGKELIQKIVVERKSLIYMSKDLSSILESWEAKSKSDESREEEE